MGVSIDTGRAGGKKSVDAELNLIPFIDLLICCICFLLITAVWIQLARINVNQRGPATGGRSTEKQQTKISVLVGDEGYVLTAGSERLVIPKQGPVYDTTKLKTRLSELKTRLPMQASLTVSVEDGVAYRHIIHAMDTALQSRFSQIQVSDSGARL